MSARGVSCLAVFLLACGGAEEEPRPPATTEDAVIACQDWSHLIVDKFSECLNWDQGMYEDELSAGDNRCWDEVREQPDQCRTAQRDAFESCAEYHREDTCDELCPNGNCFVLCLYYCP